MGYMPTKRGLRLAPKEGTVKSSVRFLHRRLCDQLHRFKGHCLGLHQTLGRMIE